MSSEKIEKDGKISIEKFSNSEFLKSKSKDEYFIKQRHASQFFF